MSCKYYIIKRTEEVSTYEDDHNIYESIQVISTEVDDLIKKWNSYVENEDLRGHNTMSLENMESSRVFTGGGCHSRITYKILPWEDVL